MGLHLRSGSTGPVSVDLVTADVQAMMVDAGTATGGAAATITDTAKSWTVNALAGYVIRILSGTGAGEWRVIASNTANTITVPAWGVAPAAASTYAIFAGLDSLLTTAVTNADAAVDLLTTAVGLMDAAADLTTTALGTNTTAVGTNSTALGTSTTAVGLNTTAVTNADAAVDLLTTAVGALETDVTTLEDDIETLELAVEANTAALSNPDAVTFNAPVAINAAGTVYTNLGYTAAELTRLHELSITLSVADTVFLYSADDAAGTNKAEVCRWNPAATAGPRYQPRVEAAFCLKTAAVGKYLLLYAATATLTGFAITSHKAT